MATRSSPRTRGSAAADNPLPTPRSLRTAGTAENPFVVNSSPLRTPGSTANPLVLHSSSPHERRASTGRSSTSSAVRTVASTRSARVAAATSPTPLRINRGPPSTIPRQLRPTAGVRGQPYPPGLLGDLAARDAATRQRNRARIDAESAAFRAAHPVVPHVQLPRIRTRRPKAPDDGARTLRDEPLTLESLLVNGVAPPMRSTAREHQKCGICLYIKSHPVSYRCGHSHCYRCIRLWLETRWTCPECRTVMNDPPYRNYSEEAGILLDHPDWHDRSRVDYNWDGLRFPKVRILSDDEW
ncbi:hypothetical protein B0H11DRAFT_2259696 [Mycena galericulata]|nr:hypothetical protein B0H11DRAFT_2259696 [Mycena galericulata]